MSTSLYYVQVLEKADVAVTVRVTVLYQDMEVPANSKNFFLQTFWSQASWSQAIGSLPAPLLSAIAAEDIRDEGFRLRHAGDYVASVEVLREHGGFASDNPAYDDDDDDEQDEEELFERLTWADTRVTVTDARWIAHLTPGDGWDTTAYDI